MKLLILTILAVCLTGCGTSAAAVQTVTETSAAVETVASVSVPETVAAVLSPEPALPVIPDCTATGRAVIACDSAVADWSNASDGYVMVRYTEETEKRLKLRISRNTTYTYNLTPGQWAVFPLTEGSGTYRVTLYRQTSGNSYATVLSGNVTAELTDEFAPFLRPNQYVDYSNAPEAMALGAALCTGLENPLDKVEAVYDHVVTALSYDYDKAATVKSGYLPVLDTVLAEGKGICFDYAALMTGILRSQQIPCKLVVGYAGSVYHAWISVWTEETGWVDGILFFDGHSWKRMDPTFASSGGEEILDFIENGNYTEKYLY